MFLSLMELHLLQRGCCCSPPTSAAAVAERPRGSFPTRAARQSMSRQHYPKSHSGKKLCSLQSARHNRGAGTWAPEHSTPPPPSFTVHPSSLPAPRRASCTLPPWPWSVPLPPGSRSSSSSSPSPSLAAKAQQQQKLRRPRPLTARPPLSSSS